MPYFRLQKKQFPVIHITGNRKTFTYTTYDNKPN